MVVIKMPIDISKGLQIAKQRGHFGPLILVAATAGLQTSSSSSTCFGIDFGSGFGIGFRLTAGISVLFESIILIL